MPAYSLEQARAQLAAYLAAEIAVLAKQSFSLTPIGGTARQMTLADLATIQKGVAFWRDEVNRLAAAGQNAPRVRYGVLG